MTAVAALAALGIRLVCRHWCSAAIMRNARRARARRDGARAELLFAQEWARNHGISGSSEKAGIWRSCDRFAGPE